MIDGISIICFASSYAVTLTLEISRLFFRVRTRTVLSIGFAAAGLLAHTLHLFVLARDAAAGEAPLTSWYLWCVVAAWVLAVAYLCLALAHPRNSLGVFMLPVVLALVGLAYLFRDADPFPADRPYKVWGMIHGVMLLLGCVGVAVGFIAGAMYLIQSSRLKHKLAPSQRFPLPSLESLGRINGRSMIVSTTLLTAGLVSGILLNVSTQSVPWTDPTVWASNLLFLWLVAITLFEYVYKPARQGRKVAYLTLTSFLFFGLVLCIVLFFPTVHATKRADGESRRIDRTDVSGGQDSCRLVGNSRHVGRAKLPLSRDWSGEHFGDSRLGRSLALPVVCGTSLPWMGGGR